MKIFFFFQAAEAAPVEDNNHPVSPSVNIKDEPEDEGYDAALLPQSSARQIKEELEQEVSQPHCYSLMLSYIFRLIKVYIKRFVFFFVAFLNVVYMSGSNVLFCLFFLFLHQVLLKGQTAFQRKGSTQLFCSTVCLTGHLPPIAIYTPLSAPHAINKIVQPRDMVTIPASDRSFMHFCGQFCLSKPTDRQPVKPLWRLHNLCSDACFATWRMMRQLAMNCCEVCGLYCNSSSGSCQTLTIEKSQLNFCSPTCISTYKQVCVCRNDVLIRRDQKGKVQLYCSATCVGRSRPQRHILTDTAFPCSLCKVSAVPQFHLAMADGTIRNFCSFSCVTIYRSELTNGTPSLKDPVLTDAPKMGLSSEDSSIPSSHIDSQSSLTYQGSHPSQTSVPPLVSPYTATFSQSLQGQTQTRPPSQSQKPAVGGSSDGPKVTCHQCFKQFNTKPLLFSHCGRIFVFCQMQCSEQYKIQRNILAVCEYCKQEKVHYDTICFNQKDLFFCGEKCKSQFKQDQVSHKKDQSWNPCSYCGGISQNVVPVYSHFGGRMEEFCRSHCMSQYTVLYYGMGRCDSCRKQGQLMEKLQCLGSVRNFCDMPCLLQYCYFHFETIPRNNSTGTAPQTPRGKKHLEQVKQKILALPTTMIVGNALEIHGFVFRPQASTQTDALRVPVPRRRQMKNKSVLCRPITMDQENMCQLPAVTNLALCSSAGEPGVKREPGVKLQMVPIPVPVFIPVPMNMYSQYTPVTMTIPMPVGISVSLDRSAVLTSPESELNHMYGVKAWRSWVQQSRHPDVLQAEWGKLQCRQHLLPLSRNTAGAHRYCLYQPCICYPIMTILSLLSFYQYLFLKGRIENIFTDDLYSQFASDITGMLRQWKPNVVLSAGCVALSRVEESFLWECKQLGAYSPIVLLNTLLFFCTKNFSLSTVAQHQSLSFSNLIWCSRVRSRGGKVHYLVFLLSVEHLRTKQAKNNVNLEMVENISNPLHCPVRLYEFYLSRCPESAKQRGDLFYLQPEQNVHTHRSESLFYLHTNNSVSVYGSSLWLLLMLMINR
uniref:Zinc finger MYM-type protein 4-like n=1 Tax=Gouania willdenowi TaxID=441366 RepID=A0A8C5E822_GOUWI